MKKKPFFKPKSLTFKNSGHTLTLSKESYRCVRDCKGKCDQKEPQINKRRLERNFSNLAQEFEIKDNSFGKIYGGVFAEYLPIILIEALKNAEQQDEVIDTTLEVMQKEIELKNIIKKSDKKDLREALAKQNSATFLLVLFGYLLGFAGTFSYKENEKEWGKTLALITKNIYLSEQGKIESILLEKWGWYIVNFVNKYYPDYISKIKQKGVSILNEKEDYCNYGLMDAVHYFENQDFQISMSDYKNNQYYNLLEKFQGHLETLASSNIQEVQKSNIMLYNEMAKNPQMIMAENLSIIVGK